jgi:putative sterol carrier protein
MSLQVLTDRIKALVGNDSGLNASAKFVTNEGVVAIDAKQVPNLITNEDIETDCALEISVENALNLISGDLNPMMAYMTGKLKIKGDMGVAMKIGQSFAG